MKKLWLVATLFIVFALAGLAVYVTFWDIPPPKTRIEVQISNDRFPN